MATIPTKTLKEIRALVQINDHGGAYQLAAKELGDADLAEQFASINRRNLELGHLPIDLYDRRHGLYQRLLAGAKRNLSSTNYQQLYASF